MISHNPTAHADLLRHADTIFIEVLRMFMGDKVKISYDLPSLASNVF